MISSCSSCSKGDKSSVCLAGEVTRWSGFGASPPEAGAGELAHPGCRRKYLDRKLNNEESMPLARPYSELYRVRLRNREPFKPNEGLRPHANARACPGARGGYTDQDPAFAKRGMALLSVS